MDFDTFSNHINVSRETYEKFCIYHNLLIKWQKSINLVSRETLDDIWIRHFVDSAQLASFIPDTEISLLDIGSGAGFPALILSIMEIKDVTLVESDQRKCIFLKEVARELSLDVTILNERIEGIAPSSYDMITARACASLSQLFSWAYPFCHDNTICLFPKGENWAKEWKACDDAWSANMTDHMSITHDTSRVLEIKKLEKRAR